MFENTQNTLNDGIRKFAESKLLKRLNENGINRSDLNDEKFNELVEKEIEIIKSDGKKVGAGIGIGAIVTTLLFGF